MSFQNWLAQDPQRHPAAQCLCILLQMHVKQSTAGRAVEAVVPYPAAPASPELAGAAALAGRQQRGASRSRSGAVRTYAAKQLHFNTNGEALKRMQVHGCSRRLRCMRHLCQCRF